MNEICKELQILPRGIVSKRQIAMEMGEVKNDDLLGISLESNSKEIREHGRGDEGMQALLLCWIRDNLKFARAQTLVLLSTHPEWQLLQEKRFYKLLATKGLTLMDLAISKL